jgi:aspartate/methionine/tyrosine aminotransferase
MSAPVSPTLAAAVPSPVMEARRWIAGRVFPADRPLINLSQAAPVDPPPRALREAVAAAALDDPAAHVYGPVLGDPALREAIAARWSAVYGGAVGPEAVAVTAGCNQAFCAAVATVCAPGDAVILPTPWYFNHRMWLDMAGVATVPCPCGPDGLPDPDRVAALIGPRVRAVTLVTPNNPTGAEHPPALVAAFANLCRVRGLALILDETYRDFRRADGPPHGLFADPDWGDVLIHLYSFSKVYRLTGHRVGALLARPDRVAQAEKFLDTTTICPPRLGQIAALHGLRTLGDWVAAERAEVLARRAAVEAGFAEGVGGWRLRSCGAYFAFLEHPFDVPSDAVARALVDRASLLTLPGTMFGPARAGGGDGTAERTLRLAFANADRAGIAETLRRLRAFAP